MTEPDGSTRPDQAAGAHTSQGQSVADPDSVGGRFLKGALGKRLLGWFLLLSLTPLLLSNALGYWRSQDIISGLVDRYLKGIADLQALHISGQVDHHRLILREMASAKALDGDIAIGLGGRGGEVVSEYLAAGLAVYGTFEALYVFAPGGRILASAPLPPEDLSIFMEPPLTDPAGEIEIVRTDRAPRAPQLRVTVPVPTSGEGPVLYLGGMINVVGSPGLVELPEHTARSVETFIVDRAGALLYVSHPHGHLDYAARFETPLLSSDTGISAAYQDRQGIEVVGTAVEVPGRPWRLITEVPVADVLSELRQLRGVSYGLGLLLTVLVVGLASLVSVRIVAPVRRLLEATRRLGTGDLAARVEVRGEDEISELGNAFNDMASKLSENTVRIRELHRREMERAGQLATVGELASGVAHEIKNPAAGLSGGLDLVVKRLPADDELSGIVAEMRRQISRIEAAVRDLLTFARPPSPRLASTDLNRVVERALTLVRPAVAKTRVNVALSLEENLPVVLADQEMMYSALVNLIMNGVQATDPGGRVDIHTEVQGDEVLIRVRDTGRGIAPDQLDQIFKPFFTTRHHGTGLGLSISRSVVERHMGTVSVESRLGHGSTFTVRLPRRSAAVGRATNLTDGGSS